MYDVSSSSGKKCQQVLSCKHACLQYLQTVIPSMRRVGRPHLSFHSELLGIGSELDLVLSRKKCHYQSGMRKETRGQKSMLSAEVLDFRTVRSISRGDVAALLVSAMSEPNCVNTEIIAGICGTSSCSKLKTSQSRSSPCMPLLQLCCASREQPSCST